jgi:hypothetical protein
MPGNFYFFSLHVLTHFFVCILFVSAVS